MRAGYNNPIYFATLAILAGFLFSGPAKAASPEEVALIQSILGEVKQVQDGVQTLNYQLGKRYQTPRDVEERMKWLRYPHTDEERSEEVTTSYWLPVIQSHEKAQSERVQDLARVLEGSETRLLSELDSGRFLGTRVPETVELYNGVNPSVKWEKDDGGIGTLGTAVREACYYNPKAEIKDPLDAFLNMHYVNMSCMTEPESVKLVVNPQDSLNEKLFLLTGSRLTEEQIEKHSEKTVLDFTNAPELETIILGYLEFKYDFTGSMIAQALKYHAKKGAQIRIIVTDHPFPGTSFLHKEDRYQLDELAKFSSNIQIQKFRMTWHFPDPVSIGKYLEHSFHAKALIVLAKDPSKSGVIVGGRNLKDTFALRKLPTFEDEKMTKYGGNFIKRFVPFDDLEILVRGKEVAEQAAAQFMAFWHRDTRGPRTRRMSEHIPALSNGESMLGAMRARAKTSNLVRFFFSAPYLDDRSLVKLYLDLINSAQKKLRIVMPYVRPEKAITEALLAAARRGVDIDFVTNFSYVGDNSPSFTGAVNKDYFNTLLARHEKDVRANAEPYVSLGKITVYAWKKRGLRARNEQNEEIDSEDEFISDEKDSILHSKAILADEDVLYVGSANFNHRTFWHDTEDGYVVTGEAIPQFIRLFQGTYIKDSEPVMGYQNTNFFLKLILPILGAMKVN